MPPNIMRTMPITIYLAVGGYAAAFRSREAAWLELGLLCNELLNFSIKWSLRKIVGPHAELLRRPEGAMDSGLYPQREPKRSTSSGMPSGHSQTVGFLAASISPAVMAGSQGAADARLVDSLQLVDGESPLGPALSLTLVWFLALVVALSRTQFGGLLQVQVSGRRVAQHTLLQVTVGLLLGGLLGRAACTWHYGLRWWPWVVAALGLLLLVLSAALLWDRLVEHEVSDFEDADFSKAPSGSPNSIEMAQVPQAQQIRPAD